MKYIVLYTLTLFLINIQEAAAQKPTIDLLPSSHAHLHPEAVIDTSYTGDSLIQIFPDTKYPSKPVKEIRLQESHKYGNLPGYNPEEADFEKAEPCNRGRNNPLISNYFNTEH